MLQFLKRGCARELPEDIKQVLRSRYHLYTLELFSMKYVEKDQNVKVKG